MERILDGAWTFRSPRAWSNFAINAHRRLIPILLTFPILATVPVSAQAPARSASRAEATAIIANARKVVTPNGVERLEKIRIGGIRSVGLGSRC
jgi:hypothetical protein